MDAWNIEGYGNNVDTVKDVQQFSGTYSGGRIKCRYILFYSMNTGNIVVWHHWYSCSVAKRITPLMSGTGQDLDLNNNYYILYGRRIAASVAGALIPHEQGLSNNPSISSVTVNPVTAGGSVGVFPKLQLLRFHGILMIVAWPLLALCGIFFASWMRPALPNGEWFQVHNYA